jgi:hypothetical protein
MSTRHGSVIIYCIGLAAILVVLGYGFLRSTLSDTSAGDASQKVLLARSAARMGNMRAVEGIIEDYVRSGELVNTGASGSTTVGAITYLDGPWRAPFVSFLNPNTIWGVDHNTTAEMDDVSGENFVVQPLVQWSSSGFVDGRRWDWFHLIGGMTYDGRGRYIEAGYHPVTRPAPAGPLSKPTVDMRFSDLGAAIPERSEGLFLDGEFRRIDSGDAADDRILARYRLRYAVGVEDLGGHLLSNPYPEGDYDPRSATAAYRNPPPVVTANQHAWYNMVSSMGGGWVTTALRMEHIFLGRGDTSNVDIDRSNGGPVTFPLMFRNRIMNGVTQPYWGRYAISMQAPSGLALETDGLYLPSSIGGGDPIPPMDAYYLPIVAHGFGPQISWYNQHHAALGYFDSGNTYDKDGSIGYEQAQFIPTPFGRRLQKSADAPGSWKWYEGRVDTPWYVNVLTASPRTVHCMLLSYLPASVKSILLQTEAFSLYKGKDPIRSDDLWYDVLATNIATPGTPVQMQGRDNFTKEASPAFSYSAPSADGITPNYQKGDARGIEARYPGQLWNANDDLGREIDLDSKFEIGRCSHTRLPFYFGFSAQMDFLKSADAGGSAPWTTTPPPGWGQPRTLSDGTFTDGGMDKVRVSPQSGTIQRYTFEQSYWWDLMMAFTTTISTVRAAWVQFPTQNCDPYVNMDPALHDPSAFDTIEEVDRLFLRQLGEDFDNPGSGTPLTQIICRQTNTNSLTYRITGAVPSNTICMLKDKGLVSPDEANVMERVLNDIRMSFFGAGPQYSESFRPKDFSGDGKVHCSAYARDAGASQLDEDNGVAWWKPADGAGNGPVVDEWFSLSGCFYIGRSHYYRIFSRGAVWDNIIEKTVADQLLESVLCVDPEGTDPSDVKVLFQRWHYDRSTVHLPRQSD